jgi:superoxide dismutase, Cu-Zn family
MKRLAAMAFALLSVALAASACTRVSTGAAASATGSPSPSAATHQMAHGIFVSTTPPPSGVINAYAYDVRLVPRSAAADLMLTTVGGKTQALLTVSGFLPNRMYGAHLHVNPCGVDPKAAGGHFQHTPDPAASQSPSTDPAFANPTNEVWLDFDTDPKGSASSSAEVPWVTTPEHRPKSLVIHADMTLTAPGKAGTAGARIACLTLPA